MSDKKRILVINPNASTRVTQVIDRELNAIRKQTSFTIDVCDHPSAPPGIARQQDADMVAPLVQQTIRRERASAYVVACFSDPGLTGAREESKGSLVLGCGESAILHALTIGDQFGIISLSDLSTLRQRRMVRMMGLTSRYAGSAAISATAEEATSPLLIEKMVEAGRALASGGANVILMGCAGMAHFRSSLEDRLGMPVIDPTSSAVAMALGLCTLRESRLNESDP
ncbi:aspartate/glutamate racemase family protein [Gluconacetobacter azotocaptans]|nr:aspartate/glutamate racemase family protein [Gluconacetobacter azotocaptans]MBM9402786.1 hypothetical protein [Gluconacetobacter azotocaptans]GBQ29639.1 hydantoin racemase [Gluconacetobacter azotocaptans DSM 13594]